MSDTSAADEPAAVAPGEALYYAHGCYACHGYNGETGVVRLAGTDSPTLADAGAFIAFLRARADLSPLFPSTRMPSYPEAALSDAEARQLYAYVRSFRLDAPGIDEEPVLKEILDSASRPR